MRVSRDRRAPPLALGEYIRAHAPVRDDSYAFREKGRSSKLNREHRWMLEKE